MRASGYYSEPVGGVLLNSRGRSDPVGRFIRFRAYAPLYRRLMQLKDSAAKWILVAVRAQVYGQIALRRVASLGAQRCD